LPGSDLAEAFVQLIAMDGSGRYRVRCNAIHGNLLCQRGRHRDHRCLGGTIIGPFRRSHHRRHAGDIDDSSPFGSPHAWQQPSGHPYCRQHVPVVTGCPCLRASGNPVFHLAGAACVVDQDFDWFHESLRIIGEPLYVIVIRQVAKDRIGTPTLGDDVVGDFFGTGFVAAMDDDDSTLTRQASGYSFADTLAASCDKRNFSIKFQIHLAIPMLVRCTDKGTRRWTRQLRTLKCLSNENQGRFVSAPMDRLHMSQGCFE